MLKRYNEFVHENIDPKVGQSYLVDGKRMNLNIIKFDRYIFSQGDDYINVPADKLDLYVQEN